MNSEQLWNSIVFGLSSSEEELQTTTGLWFRASSENDKLFVEQAVNHSPSSDLTKPRTISKRDFSFVHSYYDRWTNGEIGIRHEVSRKSRNTAYIFALIDSFENRR